MSLSKFTYAHDVNKLSVEIYTDNGPLAVAFNGWNYEKTKQNTYLSVYVLFRVYLNLVKNDCVPNNTGCFFFLLMERT